MDVFKRGAAGKGWDSVEINILNIGFVGFAW
jgi:hypothetical protein